MKNRVILLTLGCLMNCFLLCAQMEQYRFSHLDISRGLSHNQVNTILKDSKGFIWFGTMSGLNRFDGYQFRTFRHKAGDSTSISDDYIEKILEGPEGWLYIITRNGHCIYDPVTEKFSSRPDIYLNRLSVPGGLITDMVKDSRGNFWLTQPEEGLSIYHPTTKKVKRLKNRPDKSRVLASNDITDLHCDSSGNVWILHHNGYVEKADSKTGTVTGTYAVLYQQHAGELNNYRFFADADGALWIFTASDPRGVFYFDPVANILQHLHKDAVRGRLSNNLVTGIQQDNKGMIWISTDHGGINLVNKKDLAVRYLLSNADYDNSLSQNSINTIYRDNTGILWIGTYKNGVDYYHENIFKFPVYRHRSSDPNSLPYDDVNRFVEDDKGNLWIGTNGGGLLYFDRQQGTYRQFRHEPGNGNSLSNDVIVSLFIDHEKKLWIGTYFGGLDCFDGKKFIHYRHDPGNPAGIPDNRIWEIFEDSQNRLWVGTLAGGLSRLDRDRNVFHHYQSTAPNSLKSDYIASIMEDKAGKLWIGTATGISVLDSKADRFTYYNYDPGDTGSISNDNIIAIIEDSHGRIWVGTREGLNLFDKKSGKFRRYHEEDGLPSNTILTILEDDKHNIWLSTPNGLCRVTIQGDNGPAPVLQFKNYDERDGLQGRTFNENAALKTRNGELVFGGAKGFNIIDPATIAHNTTMPKVVLTDLRVFDKSIRAGEQVDKRVLLSRTISETENITLRYYENVFSLEFAALNFSNPEKNRYVYKLEGFNREWLTTDGITRKATYTNLDPGEYIFRVKAGNDEGVWNEEGLALRIKILPPFWLTIPAYIIYALVLAGMLFLARRLVIQRARMRFRLEQQKKEADRMHELDKLKLRFFTNVSHEFRTPLSLIIAPVEKIIKETEEPEKKKQFQLIHRNAKRLLGLVNQLLDFRKLEMQELRLHPQEGDIIPFIKDLVYSFTDISVKKNITYSYNSSVESLVVFFDTDKLERILFNLLSNAFKFTRESGNVSVNISLQQRENAAGELAPYVEIRIKDTGIGIPPEDHDKIFERFFQHDLPGSMLNQGSGIGLAITREFVRLHQGTIRVESEPGKGSCFIVQLPVKPVIPEVYTAAGKEDSMINTAHEEEEVAHELNGNARRKPVILVIDDNEDIRFYIKDNLRAGYIVYEAANGSDGWKKALQYQPDLVVSDIMMPDINGLELCRKIKSDPQTSHIPVILLTARTAEEQKLEGFDTGASDYITKPFSFEILQSRIRNLLAQQEHMRRLFQKQIEVNPGEISVSSVDEQFIRQVLEVVEKNISNTEFSVEELSREMHMSRVALYKKLLSLTGKTPLDFIRSIRMKRAAQLLEKSQMNISEIAWEVGFNNPKYFARFFRKEFNVLPSEYISVKRKKGGWRNVE